MYIESIIQKKDHKGRNKMGQELLNENASFINDKANAASKMSNVYQA